MLLTEIGIPTAEYVLPFFVEDASTDLQQEVRSSLHCICCLLAMRLLTTWLIADSTKPVLILSAVTVAFAVVRNKTAIAFDVCAEFLNRFEQLARGLLLVLECCALQIHLHKLQGGREKWKRRERGQLA